MSRLLLGTESVSLDEPALSLKELKAPRPDSKGVERYQIVRVLRGDQVVEFRRSLGPADSFAADEFVIPGGVVDARTGRGEILHTVGELIDIADYLRAGLHRPPETPKPYDMITAYRALPDKYQRNQRRLSTFGPGRSVIRA